MAVDMLVDSGKLDACCAAEAAAIIAKGGGTAPLAYDFANNKGFADAIAAIPSGGITPTGSVTLTEEDTYDVTDKAQAIVDFSTTRANLAEAVTAKGVDTLPTSSFDTIATNIGLISGGAPTSTVTTAQAYSLRDTLADDISQMSGYASFIAKNKGAIPSSGYWLYYILRLNKDGATDYMTYRRTSGGAIGWSYAGTSVVVSQGEEYEVLGLDDFIF